MKNAMEIHIEENISKDGMVNGKMSMVLGEDTKSIEMEMLIKDAKIEDNNNVVKKAAMFAMFCSAIDPRGHVGFSEKEGEQYNIDLAVSKNGSEAEFTGNYSISIGHMLFSGTVNNPKVSDKIDSDFWIKASKMLTPVKTVSFGNTSLHVKMLGGIELSIDSAKMDADVIRKAIEICNKFADPEVMAMLHVRLDKIAAAIAAAE